MSLQDEDDEERRHLIQNVIGDYKRGSIRRIALQNFLTYSNVEVCPGPRLNMVIGPNGTGKSTILCAICLGLGGEPKVLGRASDIATFVKTGETEATVEIELESGMANTANPVFRRIIRSVQQEDSGGAAPGAGSGTTKSCFFLNDQPISAKKVRSLVLEEYCISIDNLCTFLPQDRVGSFSGFDSKALLLETEKSLSASQHLYHTHQDLIQAEIEIKSNGNKVVETLEERVAQLKSDQSRLGRELRRMEERNLALQQAELISKKLIWLKFDAARQECMEAKEVRSKAKAELKEKKNELLPLQEQHEKIQQDLQQYNTRLTTLNKRIQSMDQEMTKHKRNCDFHEDKVEEVLTDLRAMDSIRAQKQQQLEACKGRVANFESIIQQFPPLDTIKEEYQTSMEERKEVLPKLEDAKRKFRQQQEQLRDVQEQQRHTQNKLDNLRDEKARRKERLFRQQPHLKKIVDWIAANSNKFRRPVSGPIACEISASSKPIAAYLEHHVPNTTLKAFVVECKDDSDVLYKAIREQMKIPINIVLVQNGKLRPQGPRNFSPAKLQILKERHGILGYLDELFTAPDPVMQALKSHAAVHTVLIGSDRTQKSLDRDNLLEYLMEPEANNDASKKSSCILFAREGSENGGGRAFKYQTIISRYSNKPSTRIDETPPARWLAPGVSDDVKARVEQELQEHTQVVEELSTTLKTAEDSIAQYREKADRTMQQVKKAKESLDDYKRVQVKLASAQRKLKDMETALEVDSRAEQQAKVAELKNSVAKSISSLQAHANSHKSMMEVTYKVAGVRLNKEKVDVEERRVRDQILDLQQEFDNLERVVKEALNRYNQLRSELEALKRQAESEAPFTDDDGNELPLKAQLEALPVDNVDDAEAALEEATAKANSIIEVDPSVLQRYERQEKELEEKQQELDHLKASRESKLKDMQSKRSPWEWALKNIITKVDVLFSQYMKEMGFKGGVSLLQGDPESATGDFQEWGIQITVAFRENTKEQVLTARVQSGGERSVSTIMYLMALQSLMVSPFRCVDEINQGLDDRNERLVFQRIVANSTQPPRNEPTDHSGQYFLITPKLLPNLVAMEEEAMTVLAIFNGPYNFKSPRDWDAREFCALRNRPRRELQSHDSEDEENLVNEQKPRAKRTSPGQDSGRLSKRRVVVEED